MMGAPRSPKARGQSGPPGPLDFKPYPWDLCNEGYFRRADNTRNHLGKEVVLEMGHEHFLEATRDIGVLDKARQGLTCYQCQDLTVGCPDARDNHKMMLGNQI